MRKIKKLGENDFLKQLLVEDIHNYFSEGELRESVPQEIKLVIDHISKVVEAEYKSQILIKQMELSTLQSQINPHFLYNTLEAIRSEALINGITRVAEMTERLSRLFRYGISSKGDFVTIQEEINNITDYFSIVQFRFEDRYKMKTIITDDDVLECYIPKMTMQPIIENAINHGLEQKKDCGEITVRVIGAQKTVYIIISDNGVGMADKKVAEINLKLKTQSLTDKMDNARNGIALSNVNARIVLNFGSDYGLHLSSTMGLGTDVHIVLPYINDSNYREFKNIKIAQ